MSVSPPGAGPTVVLDTNVVLDLWLFQDAAALGLRAALEGHRLDAVRSAACDHELADVLRRPQFAAYAAAGGLLRRWQSLARPLEPRQAAPWHCSDRDDQKFLDLAHAAAATVLVTKDRALLKLARAARARGLAIVAVAGAASLLGIEDRVA